ncbi:DUF6197 family protein [Nucisporomicrobium flavum]|uniref:DUF6197 family protein n=1 Tax=Nucisporomicrobium flavum TaxID=2785915 RepID=UPI0018F556EA|nr:hypothetical protein [Nucisporomicrobium flavum]
MTRTIDERPTTPHGGPVRQQRPDREGVRRSLLARIRAFRRPEPDAPPWQGRPEEAYHVLQDARAVIAQGWIQDRWYARTPAPLRPGAQSSLASDNRGGAPAACLVGAVVYAARQRGPGDDFVKAGPALDHLWDAWQEARGLGGTGIAGWAAPRELRLARVCDLTRWNDQPGRTREEVLDLVDRATSRAVMAAMNRLR